MNIITGYRGKPHVTSAQDRARNQGVIGEGSYILDVGQQLAAEVVSANEVRVRDGVLSHQGCIANIEQGAYDSLDISNGTQGMLRTDLIVARYTKDAETNIEDISLVVIEGTAAASSPDTPSYNSGSIQAGDSPVDMPLYKVNINGVSIDSVTQIAPNVWSLQSIGSTALPTTAQTITGAIAEHEQDISTINANLSYKPLNIVRTENAYVNEEALARVYAYKIGQICIILLNLTLTANMPANTLEVEIGKIEGYSGVRNVFVEVPCQTNASVLLVTVRASGGILIANPSSTATGASWFRTTITSVVN